MNTEHTSVADMMSGLMMVFLFIAVAFMLTQQDLARSAEQKSQTMRAIAEVVEHGRAQINQALSRAFVRDFQRWDAELLHDNTVRFRAPDVLFEPGKADLTRHYQNILSDFFPRYVAILYRHRAEIEAIRIEGHTSSDWGEIQDVGERFVRNMELSQQRALETLVYCYRLISNGHEAAWLRTSLTGNGRSFERPIRTPQGAEEPAASRRVEFKVLTRAEERLYRILDVRGASS
jgi:outer membrane protein OmpA-like peptidoglycan-associated protein